MDEEYAWKHVDAALKASRDPPNSATMKSIYGAAFNVWSGSFAETFRPILGSMHRCVKEECSIESILVQYMLQKPEHEDVVHGRSHSIMHLCVRVIRNGCVVVTEDITEEGDLMTNEVMHCTGMDHDQAFGSRDCLARGQVDNLYVCAATGLAHVCDPDSCPYGINFSDMHGDTVCSLTGRVLEDHKMVSIYWMPGATPSSNGDTFNGDAERKSGRSSHTTGESRTGSGHQSGMSAMDTSAYYIDDMSNAHGPKMNMAMAVEFSRQLSRHRPINRTPYRKYVNLAVTQLCALFSRERYILDMEAAVNANRLASREVIKQYRTNKSMDAVSMIVAHIHAMRSRGIPPNLDIPAEARKSFIASSASKCIKFWAVIRTRTRRGREEPNLFLPIGDFAVAAMYKFAKGIYLPPEVTGGAGEHMIEMDPVLKKCMPRFCIIDQLGCTRDSVSAIEKAIASAIIDAVHDDHVDPKTLHPSSIVVEQLDDCIFRTMCKSKGSKGTNSGGSKSAIPNK